MKYSVLITLEYLRLIISHGRLKYSFFLLCYVSHHTEIFCTQYEPWCYPRFSPMLESLNKISCHFEGPYNVPGTFLDTLGTFIIVLIVPVALSE